VIEAPVAVCNYVCQLRVRVLCQRPCAKRFLASQMVQCMHEKISALLPPWPLVVPCRTNKKRERIKLPLVGRGPENEAGDDQTLKELATRDHIARGRLLTATRPDPVEDIGIGH
jgi:hypothetical protein